MRRQLVVLTVAALALIPLGTSAQQNYEVCNRLIDHGLNNIAIRTSSYGLADRVWWDFCDEKYEAMSEEKKREFGITIESIPLSASDAKATTKEKHSKFCGTYKTSTDIRSDQAVLTSKMHDRAVDAWRSCVFLVNAGMWIDYRIPANQKYADIFVKYTGSPGSTKFNGIESTGFVCSVGGSPIGSGTSMVITPAETAIRCDRQSITQSIGGVTSDYYPDGGITVKTDAGNGSAEFVAMVDGPALNRFGQVDTQIAGIRSDLAGLSQNLQAWNRADASRGNHVGWGDPSGTTTCPAGQYAVGFQYWGAPGPIKYCIGCASGFQVICRPLNSAVASPVPKAAASGQP